MYLAHRIQQPIPKLLVRIFANFRSIRTFLQLLFDFLYLFVWGVKKSWRIRIFSFWIWGWIWWARYFYICLKMKSLLLLSSPVYSFIFLSKSQSILFLFYDYIVEEIHQTSWINLWNENIKKKFCPMREQYTLAEVVCFSDRNSAVICIFSYLTGLLYPMI